MMKGILKKGSMCLLILVLFLQTSSFQWFKSVVVMSVYSNYEASRSVLEEKGIEIKIPGGTITEEEDWYPFVITFNDDKGFSWYIGEEARMTVLYNFGHFDPMAYRSLLYDVDSPYYNSFYGGYAVTLDSGEPFAFAEDEPDIEAMVQIPQFDMMHLVQRGFGNSQPAMTYEVVSSGYKTLFDDEEWFYFDATMEVSGALHSYKKDYRSYIQYGRPPVLKEEVEDYEVRPMVGRIYGRHDDENDISLFLYCIASDQSVVDAWEEHYMSQTEIIYKN